jgi:hypothetical protein
MEAQATEKRCGRCRGMKSPKQCGTCKRSELRKIKNETGVEDPRLRTHREKDSQNKREQRKSASAHGYTYNKKQQCKGPDQLVKGSTGSTCTRNSVSVLSRDGRSFCGTCFDKAFGRDARKHLNRSLRYPRCVGLGPKSKVCRNRIDPAAGIRGALIRTGMKAEEFRAATQTVGGLKSLFEAHDKSKMCLECFKIHYPNWAATLRQFTQCIFVHAGVRCQRTANAQGLCYTHCAAKLPRAETVAAKRRAAEIPAVECPTRGKRPKR